MKNVSLFLAAGLMALTASCNDGLMDRSSLDMDAIDWSLVDENVFLGKNNENERVSSNDELFFLMATFPPSLEALRDRYTFYLATSSDQYYLQIELNGDHPFPFNEKGVLSVDHLVTAGDCKIFPKDKALVGPFGQSGQGGIRFPVKLLIDCDVRLDGEDLSFGPGEYGNILKGNSLKGSVQVKMLTEDRDKYSFSFNSLTPYLSTGNWIPFCSGDLK